MRAILLGGVALAAAAVILAACEGHAYPGELIASFSLTATPTLGGLDECRAAGYAEIPEPDSGFSFSAIFSNTEDGVVHMTIQDFVRDATFDGTVFASPYSAPREFSQCDGGAVVDEELFVVPISVTQSPVLGIGSCPEDPLQPGVIPVDPDAGIYPPGFVNGHFEAVRACGRLRDTIHPVGDGACPVCTMTFHINGPRL